MSITPSFSQTSTLFIASQYPRHPPCALSNLTIGISISNQTNSVSQAPERNPLDQTASGLLSTSNSLSNSRSFDFGKKLPSNTPLAAPSSIARINHSGNSPENHRTGFKHCSRPSHFLRNNLASRCHLPIQPNCQRSIVSLVKPSYQPCGQRRFACRRGRHSRRPTRSRQLQFSFWPFCFSEVFNSPRFTAWSSAPRHCSPLTDTQGQSTDLEPLPIPKNQNQKSNASNQMEVKGLEPMTLCLQSRCSPN